MSASSICLCEIYGSHKGIAEDWILENNCMVTQCHIPEYLYLTHAVVWMLLVCSYITMALCSYRCAENQAMATNYLIHQSPHTNYSHLELRLIWFEQVPALQINLLPHLQGQIGSRTLHSKAGIFLSKQCSVTLKKSDLNTHLYCDIVQSHNIHNL